MGARYVSSVGDSTSDRPRLLARGSDHLARRRRAKTPAAIPTAATIAYEFEQDGRHRFDVVPTTRPPGKLNAKMTIQIMPSSHSMAAVPREY